MVRLAGVEMTRVRLTRSLFIQGQHVAEGSVIVVSRALADDLIFADSAVQLKFLPRVFSRIRLLIASWIQKRERYGSRRKSG